MLPRCNHAVVALLPRRRRVDLQVQVLPSQPQLPRAASPQSHTSLVLTTGRTGSPPMVTSAGVEPAYRALEKCMFLYANLSKGEARKFVSPKFPLRHPRVKALNHLDLHEKKTLSPPLREERDANPLKIQVYTSCWQNIMLDT